MNTQIIEVRQREVNGLNLGCGSDIKEDFMNVDITDGHGVDRVVDLEKPLPFHDNAFKNVYSRNVLEHILNLEQLMEEIHRVCILNGTVEVIVPHFSCSKAFFEEHLRFFTYNSFCKILESGKNSKKGNFEIIHKKIIFPRGINPLNYLGWLLTLNNYFCGIYENTFLRSLIPAEELHFKLKVVK